MQGTVEDLKRAFHKAKPQFYPARQRFTFPLKAGEKKPTALAAGKKLSDYDLNDGAVLIFKDLGPQVLIGQRPSKCLRQSPNMVHNKYSCSGPGAISRCQQRERSLWPSQ